MRTINVIREKLKHAQSGGRSSPLLPRVLRLPACALGRENKGRQSDEIYCKQHPEKSDKGGTSLKTAQRDHSNSKNDAGSWEQSPSSWSSFLSQGKQQSPKRKPARPRVPRDPAAVLQANTPKGPESSFFPPRCRVSPGPGAPYNLALVSPTAQQRRRPCQVFLAGSKVALG